MICQVLTPRQGEEFLSRVRGAFALGPAMEVRYRMFGTVPEMGHQFWLSHAAAIALAGNTASAVGEYDPEEMGAFLDFSGMEQFIAVGPAPAGWTLAETLYGYRAAQPLAACCPPGVTVEQEPSLWTAAEISLHGKRREEVENFYAQMCAKRNHGMARHWVALLAGKPVCAVAATEISREAAYLSQGSTLPEYRGRRIGGFLIASMANDLLAEGIEPTLLCRQERCHFYDAMGMTLTTNYNLYKKKEIVQND